MRLRGESTNVRVGKEAAKVSEIGRQRTRLSMLSRSHSKKYEFEKKPRKVYCN